MRKIFSAGVFVIVYLAIYYMLQFAYMITAGLYIYVINDNLPDAEFTDMISNEIPSAIVFAGFVSFLIYAVIVKVLKEKGIFNYCKFNRISLKKTIITVFAGLSLASLNTLIILGISLLLPDVYQAHVENMEELTSSGGLWMVFSVGLVAPFIEEVIFRGLITSELDRIMSYRWVIFIQAMLFGLYHMNMAQGIYTSVLAVFMGLTLYWTDSIWAPVIIHIVNNLSSVVVSEYLDKGSDILSIVFGIWTVMSVLIILPYTLSYLYKTRTVRISEREI